MRTTPIVLIKQVMEENGAQCNLSDACRPVLGSF